jgi:hypothetical protein
VNFIILLKRRGWMGLKWVLNRFGGSDHTHFRTQPRRIRIREWGVAF